MTVVRGLEEKENFDGKDCIYMLWIECDLQVRS